MQTVDALWASVKLGVRKAVGTPPGDPVKLTVSEPWLIPRDDVRQTMATLSDQEVLAAIGQSGGIGYSQQRAAHYAALAEAALDGLPDTDWLRALRGLAHYSVARNH